MMMMRVLSLTSYAGPLPSPRPFSRPRHILKADPVKVWSKVVKVACKKHQPIKINDFKPLEKNGQGGQGGQGEIKVNTYTRARVVFFLFSESSFIKKHPDHLDQVSNAGAFRLDRNLDQPMTTLTT